MEDPNNALAARRARLRGSLSRQNMPAVDPSAISNVSDTASDDKKQHSSTKASQTSAGARKPASSAVAPVHSSGANENKVLPTVSDTKDMISKEETTDFVADWGQNTQAEQQSSEIKSTPQAAQSLTSGQISGIEQGPGSAQALELLSNIDHALGSCATHLASLQKVAGKQIDELKVIAETLQSHTFSEIGLNINTLMESLTAAIEPMKAIGELVPALDRLVNVSELKEHSDIKPELTEKQMVASLADQLVAGVIDPWTFRSAYQAIFPEDDSIGLLHRLGELLGEQELSGDLFQAAYDALQVTQPNVAYSANTVNQVNREGITREIDQGSSDDLDFIEEEEQSSDAEPMITEKEEELSRQLLAKEQELEEFREQLDARWQELTDECDELRSALQSREDILKEKEDELNKKIKELVAKDSENQQLRAQMEELRDQTKEMVTDLQKQLAQKQAEENALRAAKSKAQPLQPGFFDLAPGSSQAANLFDSAASARKLFPEENKQPEDGSAPLESAEIEDQSTESRAAAQAGKNNSGVTAQSVPRRQSQPGPAAKTPVTAPSNANAAVNEGETQNRATAPAQVSAPQSGFASPTASFVSAAGSYGSGVRAQVFEVVVRQALAGAHWREICAVPMQINNISPDEVESEVQRRQALLKK